MKLKKLISLGLVLIGIVFLTACGNNNDTNFTLGDTFEFDGLEITLSEEIGFSRFRNNWSDHDGAYIFQVPVTVTNVGNSSHGLNDWFFTIYQPNGTSQTTLHSWYFDGVSISTLGNVQPNATKNGYIFVLYTENGEYIIAFDNHNERIEVSFDLEFDFDAVPVVQTEFVLGETVDVGGMDITFHDDISWGRIRSRWSDLDGEYYFVIPVTLTNNSDSAAGFPWGFTTFGPNGRELENLSWTIEADDVTRVGDILPGATTNGYLHVLFAGNGEYTLGFSDWSLDDDLNVRVNIEFDPNAVPVIQTVFALGETFIFDGLAITIEDDISWGRVANRWSNNYRVEYFFLPVTVMNVGTSNNSFPWGVTAFGPAGLELDRIAWDVANDDITRSGDIRPGATLTGYIHVIYDGDGEYVIQFSVWSELDDIEVIFEIER